MKPKESLSNKLFVKLKELITGGNYKAGDLFLSELELVKNYNVSRTTVREATGRLVYEGFLKKIRGKGTIITTPKIRQTSDIYRSYPEEIIKRGMKPSSQFVENNLQIPNWRIQNILQLKHGDKVICIIRIRLADEQPIAVHIAYFPYSKCSELYTRKYDYNVQPITPILDKIGVRIVRTSQRIFATAADDKNASWLKMNKYEPLLGIERINFLADDTPINFVQMYNRADKWEVTMELWRD